jgi:NAD(P)-dependent dehydrogenase (short-subunit alcohol dehydrogenase family)
MACTVNFSDFDFGDQYRPAFEGKRVVITGSGKDGGIGQALAVAAAVNGASAVGVHFHSSYRDGFDLVDAIRARGVESFALQADVNSLADLWASRSYIVEQLGGKYPDLIVCNSGLTEQGYLFGRALPEKEGESRAERRARVRNSFMDNLKESRQVIDTKVDGFFTWTHMWAGEAVYHNSPLQMIYVSSMQAIEPGMAVPGYVIANWAVLKLPEVLKVNLGKYADRVNASCIMLPFIRTGMTEEYAENPKVFGRWQSRMLETHEAARSLTQLLQQPAADLDLGNYKLGVSGPPEDLKLAWSQIHLRAEEEALDWNS